MTLEQVIKDAVNRADLRLLLRELRADEVLYATEYVRLLIETRPKEGRAHMAALELEQDPK